MCSLTFLINFCWLFYFVFILAHQSGDCLSGYPLVPHVRKILPKGTVPLPMNMSPDAYVSQTEVVHNLQYLSYKCSSSSSYTFVWLIQAVYNGESILIHSAIAFAFLLAALLTQHWYIFRKAQQQAVFVTVKRLLRGWSRQFSKCAKENCWKGLCYSMTMFVCMLLPILFKPVRNSCLM